MKTIPSLTSFLDSGQLEKDLDFEKSEIVELWSTRAHYQFTLAFEVLEGYYVGLADDGEKTIPAVLHTMGKANHQFTLHSTSATEDASYICATVGSYRTLKARERRIHELEREYFGNTLAVPSP